MKRLPLFISFILFIALCVSLAYWALQLFKPPLRPIAATPPASAPAINLEAAAGLFGGQQATAMASNIELKGIIDAGKPGESVAILAANGKPAQALAVGRELLPGLNVKEIHAGYVLLSEGGAVKRVELPEKAKNAGSPNQAITAPPVATAPPSAPSAPSVAAPTPAAPAPPPNLFVRPPTPAQSATLATTPPQTQGLPPPAAPAQGTPPAATPYRSQIVPAVR
jgi:general secretion pathway protein C